MDSYTMKKYKFSLKDECMKELPSMVMPIAAYTSDGYVKDDLSKELLINANEYNNHIASLQSIPVPEEYINQFEDGGVYNEDQFEVRCNYISDGNLHCKNCKSIAELCNCEKALPIHKVDDIEQWKLEINSACYRKNNSVAFVNWLFENYTITRKK